MSGCGKATLELELQVKAEGSFPDGERAGTSLEKTYEAKMLQTPPPKDLNEIRATEQGRNLRLDSRPRQNLFCFGPIFGDDVHAWVLVRKLLSMAGIQSALWGTATVSHTHRVPMLGENGAGKHSLPPHPSVQGQVLRRVDSIHCTDSLTYVQKWEVH